MTAPTTAEMLRISEGFVVWVIGSSVEELSVLDPLPEGTETIDARDADDPDLVDAAIVFADDRLQLAEDLDQVLPLLGSIPLVWVSFPVEREADIDETTIEKVIDDYGWRHAETVVLDETWTALRIEQS